MRKSSKALAGAISFALCFAMAAPAIPSTPLSFHSHFGHTGGSFDFPEPFVDYNVGVTAKYKNFALDGSLTASFRSDRSTEVRGPHREIGAAPSLRITASRNRSSSPRGPF